MTFHHSVPILYSEDVRRSIDYYTRVLGFASKWEWDDPPSFGGVGKDSIQIFFCKQYQGHPGTWLSIMMDDVDEYYTTIQSKGAKICAPPEDKEWGLREMLVEDPDGHIIRFGGPLSRHHKQSSDLPDSIRMVERKPTVAEYRQLTKAVGWGEKNEDSAVKALEAVIHSVVAEDSASGKTIGCVLLLGDHESFYYVKDMMVDPEWQSKRVGTALMQKLGSWLEANGTEGALVGLYTGPNLEPFYKQFGFQKTFGMSRRVKG